MVRCVRVPKREGESVRSALFESGRLDLSARIRADGDFLLIPIACDTCEGYEVVDAEKNDVRTVLRLHPALAPFKCAVLPLSKKLGDKAREIQAELSKYFMVDYDDAGSIGKRYRRQDEVGTPYCITVDFQTVGSETEEADHAVTIRNRDTMEQVRVPISELKAWLEEKLAY